MSAGVCIRGQAGFAMQAREMKTANSIQIFLHEEQRHEDCPTERRQLALNAKTQITPLANQTENRKDYRCHAG